MGRVEEAEAIVRSAKKQVYIALEFLQKAIQAVEALDAELNGVKTQAATVKAAWDDMWERKYGSPYMWTKTQDVPAMRRIVSHLGVDEVVTRARRYLDSDEAFYRRTKHPFQVFVRSINEWASSGANVTMERLAGCPHEPACASGSECTMKKLTEVRA